jgi:phosphocarrier protein
VELRRTVKVVNVQGLHARPCHSIVSAALGFQSEMRIRSGAREVNGKSILELMTLNAGVGTELEVRAWGSDAAALVARIEELFRGGFGEELELG